MSSSMDRCPDCGEELEFDEVDIGVGVQRGNWRCDNCGWRPKEAPEIDLIVCPRCAGTNTHRIHGAEIYEFRNLCRDCDRGFN